MNRRGVFSFVLVLALISLSFFAYGMILDSDRDGLPNEYELENGLDHLRSNAGVDSDMDGLLDIQEYQFNSSPVNKDTDNDGYTDKQEFDIGSNPRSDLSPRYANMLKIAIPLLIGLAIMMLIFYILHLIKNPNEKKREDKQDIRKMDAKPLLEQQPKSGKIMGILGSITESILGPSISKARERDRLLEKRKIADVEEVYLDSSKILKRLDLGNDFEEELRRKNENKQVVYTPSNDDFDFQLKKVLKDNIRKNKVSDILGYFDKEMDKEELTLKDEKKSKKEILEWYNRRKGMRDKIIDLAKEEKQQQEQVKENQPKPAEKKESTIFDRIYTGKEQIDDRLNVFDKLDKINNKK